RAVRQRRLEEADVARVAADGDRKCFDQLARGDTPVPRQGDGRVPSQPRQRRRQRAEDVGQAAGLRERHRFGPDDQRTPVRSSSAVLPGATVTAVCTDTNLTRTTITDAQGSFSVRELPICVYRVTAELQGFKTVSREAPVTANAVAKADFKLEVGTVSETVTV